MKNFVVFPWLIFIVLAICRTGFSDENNLIINADMQYSYALDRFTEKDYETAVIEFKRFIHFFPDDERIENARYKTGQSCFFLNNYGEAANIFKAITSSQEITPVVTESYFMLSRTYMLNDKIGIAEAVLRNLLILTDELIVKDRIYSALGWIYLKRAGDLEPGAFNRARNSIEQISDINADTYYKDQMLDSISTIRKAKEKNPKIAGFSAVFPGAGFWYCERYHDGVVAFLLNTALIAAACHSFDDGNNALGGILTFVGTGFYSGSIYGSVSSAHKYNKIQRQHHIQNMQRDFTTFHDTDISSTKQIKIPLITFQLPF